MPAQGIHSNQPLQIQAELPAVLCGSLCSRETLTKIALLALVIFTASAVTVGVTAGLLLAMPYAIPVIATFGAIGGIALLVAITVTAARFNSARLPKRSDFNNSKTFVLSTDSHELKENPWLWLCKVCSTPNCSFETIRTDTRFETSSGGGIIRTSIALLWMSVLKDSEIFSIDDSRISQLRQCGSRTATLKREWFGYFLGIAQNNIRTSKRWLRLGHKLDPALFSCIADYCDYAKINNINLENNPTDGQLKNFLVHFVQSSKEKYTFPGTALQKFLIKNLSINDGSLVFKGKESITNETLTAVIGYANEFSDDEKDTITKRINRAASDAERIEIIISLLRPTLSAVHEFSRGVQKGWTGASDPQIDTFSMETQGSPIVKEQLKEQIEYNITNLNVPLSFSRENDERNRALQRIEAQKRVLKEKVENWIDTASIEEIEQFLLMVSGGIGIDFSESTPKQDILQLNVSSDAQRIGVGSCGSSVTIPLGMLFADRHGNITSNISNEDFAALMTALTSKDLSNNNY